MPGNFGEPLLYEALVSKRCQSDGAAQLAMNGVKAFRFRNRDLMPICTIMEIRVDSGLQSGPY